LDILSVVFLRCSILTRKALSGRVVFLKVCEAWLKLELSCSLELRLVCCRRNPKFCRSAVFLFFVWGGGWGVGEGLVIHKDLMRDEFFKKA